MLVNDMVSAIRAAFDKRARGRQEWIDGTVELAVLLAAAREQHESNASFSVWLATNELDELGKTERANLIAMGRHPEVLRDLLEDVSSSSIELVFRKYRDRFPSSERSEHEPESGMETEVAPPAIAEPAICESAQPEKCVEASGPKGGKTPGFVELLGEELGRPLYQRFGGDSKAMGMLVKVGRMRGGKPALTRYAEVMRDHPDWKPVRHQQRMTVSLLDADMGGPMAIERKVSPDGLLKVVARALEMESSRNRPPPPAPNYAKRPARPEPAETPREDAGIVVCGKVIREKGHDPDNYPMVWAAYRAFEMIDGMLRTAHPKPGSRATVYGWAVPFIRDVDSDILASVWLQISAALRHGDPNGETSASPPNIRIKQ